MPVTDPTYYRQRALEEREMAARASSAAAKAAHNALASRYERAANGDAVELSIVERG